MLNKLLKLGLGIFSSALLAPAFFYMPSVIRDASKKYDDDCEYLMILGTVVVGEGEPSKQLTERIERAITYLNSHKNAKAVCCGGCFRKGQKLSEAEVIKRFLLRGGINESRILLEDKSTTTYENFEFALNIVENDSGKPVKNNKIAFLTSDYHIFRSGIIAAESGIDDVLKVTADSKCEIFKRYLREYFVSYDLAYRRLFKR